LLASRVRAVARLVGLLTATAAVLVTASSALAASAQLFGSRTLSQGMSGGDVRTLQSDLTKAGMKTAQSGTFTASTAQAVRSFQHRYKLATTGVVTPSVAHQIQAVDALDAATTDATPGSGGIAIASGHTTMKVQVKTETTNRKAAATADPAAVTDPVLAPVKQNGGSAHLGQRTLRQGMHGHDVRVLQSYLTIAGYPTTVDGQFGPLTRRSAVSFEKANRLRANGVVNYHDSIVLRQTVAKAMASSATPPTSTTTPVSNTTPTAKATLNANGTVTPPAGAPQIIDQVIAAANSIINTPYIYGGGHGSFNDSGYDCSGAVSFALHGGNLISAPEDSTELETYGEAGAGKWITVYADAGHAFIVIAGLAFDTAHYGPTTPGGSGPRWLTASKATANLSDGGNYIVRHPAGL
jgi:peptidoglycan hydrolase-like protein with peptidoglycan-binding domain